MTTTRAERVEHQIRRVRRGCGGRMVVPCVEPASNWNWPMVSDASLRVLKVAAFEFKCFVLRQNYVRVRRDATSAQYCSDDQLQHLNWQKRVQIVEHAWRHSPFYRKLYAHAGFEPGDLRTETDWHSLPVLTREHLADNPEMLAADNVSSRYRRRVTTGGTTGRPVAVYHDRRFSADAVGACAMQWWGLHPAMDAAHCLRIPDRSQLTKLINRAAWWPTRRVFLDAGTMTPQSIDRFLAALGRIKSQYIVGYVGAVHRLAEILLERGIVLPALTAVWVTSAPLTATARQVMQEAFRAPVYDQYGCCEVHWLAAECKAQSGLHIFAGHRHLEFVDEENRGVPEKVQGRILITDLSNYAFPIVRYENGDCGRLLSGKCSCGINLPRMDGVKGRQVERFILPDGTMISGEFLTTLFDDFPRAVNGFQVVQEADASISINVVPNVHDPQVEDSLRAVKDRLSRRVAEQVAVRIKRVDRIDADRGKTRYVLSRLHRS